MSLVGYDLVSPVVFMLPPENLVVVFPQDIKE